jgi:hypothetical protein
MARWQRLSNAGNSKRGQSQTRANPNAGKNEIAFAANPAAYENSSVLFLF